MTITLYDTLSKSMKTFQPQTGKRVTMYVCGPTVYDFPHVGNARPAIVFDILYRLLKSAYPSVLYARNYTDIDDKIFAVASETGIPYREVTTKFIAAYREDMQRLGVLTPSSEPRVTDNINEIIRMISDLIEKNLHISQMAMSYLKLTNFKIMASFQNETKNKCWPEHALRSHRIRGIQQTLYCGSLQKTEILGGIVIGVTVGQAGILSVRLCRERYFHQVSISMAAEWI